MKIFIKISLLFLFLLNTALIKAQDYHLSQYDAAPMYLNPALTGMYFGAKDIDYRFTADYRSQWRSLVRKPFVTATLGNDQKYKRFGFGAYVIQSKAGTLGFSTLNAMASAAYQIINNSDNKHHLSVGVQMGLLQKSYNAANFTFDSQYSASLGNFDNSLATGESFSSVNLFKYDANMGVFYKNTDEDKKLKPYGGFSIYHLTLPNESFTVTKTNLPARFILNGGAEYNFNELLSFVPNILFMRQEKATELNIGAQVFYHLNDTSKYTPMLGFNYRNKDAFVIQLGLKHGNNLYRISYDVNSSSLKNYSGGKGAIEFSVIYCGKRKVKEVTPSFD